MHSRNIEEIQNLVYRNKGRVVRNSEKKISLNNLPFIDFNLFNLNDYSKNFKKKFPEKPFSKPLAIYSSKGCLWRAKSGGCIYCGIIHDGWRTKNPQHLWEEISNYVHLYDVDFIWDVADTISASKKWLKEFAKSKPSNINPKFHLYARADQIDMETVYYLKSINCFEVFIGAESGDDTCLALANKGFAAHQNIKAVETLSEAGIKIILSIMIGLPGETIDSCEKTVEMVNKILNITEIEEAFVNILLPIPGCRSFDMILNHPKLKKKYWNKDLLDLEELRIDWLTYFCKINYDLASNYRDKILSLFKVGSSFGKPVHTQVINR